MLERKAFGLLTAVSIFGVLGLGTSSAGAVGDIMSLPAYACQWTGSGSQVLDWIGMYNGSTSSAMGVDCGVPTDEDVQAFSDWTVAVDDKSPSWNFHCSMRVMDTAGNTVATGAAKTSSGTGTQNIYWSLADLTPPSVFPVAGVTYVSCSVPKEEGGALSGINGIYVKKLLIMSRLAAVSVVCTATALGAGLWYLHIKPAPHARPTTPDSSQELRAEVERLRNEVSNMGAAQRAEQVRTELVAGAASAQPVEAAPKPTSPKQTAADIEKDMAERDRAVHEAVARVGDQLDELLSTDVVDTRWRADTVQAVMGVFADVAGKVLSTDCGSKVCRVVVQEPSVADLRSLPRQISQRAPFDSDVLYRYDMDANPPSVTMYMTRKGTTMASLVASEP